MEAAAGVVRRPVWLTGLTRTQRYILLSAFLGYTLDCADLNAFTLVQIPSMQALLDTTDIDEMRSHANNLVAIKLVCWGLGGIFFGVLADRWGRTRTMILTILGYAIFTGLSAFSPTYEVLFAFQALAGLFIGGEYAAGASLVVESMSDMSQRHRGYAMALIQASFAAGFLLAAIVSLTASYVFSDDVAWRVVLGFGFFPALWVLYIRRHRVADPAFSVRALGQGSVRELVRDPESVRGTGAGILASVGMMIGSWGGLTLLPVWIGGFVVADGGDLNEVLRTVSYIYIVMMAAGFPAYFLVAKLAERLKHLTLLRVVSAAGLAASLFMFLVVDSLTGIWLFAPVYGACVMGGFAIFGIVLPQWFPTRVRATGLGTTFNAGRLLTGAGLLSLFALSRSMGAPQAAATTTAAYPLAWVAAAFGRETKDKALPE
jgi:MFS family permease